MDDGDVVLQAIAAVVVMDKDGQKMLSHVKSTDLRSWEARGLIADLVDTSAAHEVWRQGMEIEGG